MNSRLVVPGIRSIVVHALAAAALLCAQSVVAQTINTIAGPGTGDGQSATRTSINHPMGIAVDKSGNVYVAASNAYTIRKIDASGLISTVAGNGMFATFSADGGAATSAFLYFPNSVAIDGVGNIYFTEMSSGRIRKVSPSGILSTVAGSTAVGFGGDGGAATSASLRPQGVATDGEGNLFVVDTGNNRIRKISPNGVISTVAGNGVASFSGDGGAATNASLNNPNAVVVDGAGNLYIADSNNQRIRKVDPGGVISTIAGNGTFGFSGDGGVATSASLNAPVALALDTLGNLYIADAGNHRIRKVTPGGVISTLAGNGTSGFRGDGALATAANLNSPSGVAVDSANNVYISDYLNNRVRKVDQSGVISTVAGNGTENPDTGDGGLATNARLKGPFGQVLDGSGNLYFADSYNHRIRKVSTSGIISTVAGSAFRGCCADDGPAVGARLDTPAGVALDAAGNLYISDTGNHRVRKVSASGVITTVAGSGLQGFDGDGGPATNARLNTPYGVAVDSIGNLYFTDRGNHRVRKVSLNGVISTVAGTGTAGYSGDGGAAANATLRSPGGVALDSMGNLYIADYANHRIRRVTTNGIITTVAGIGSPDFSGDGGLATNAALKWPIGVAVDGSGNLYIADSSNFRIRKVDVNGLISTVAGSGVEGFGGDSGLAISASLGMPASVVVDGAENLYIADYHNNRLRKVTLGYQGAWWAGASENGWGLSFIQHGSTLAVGWYYFNAQGEPTWVIVPGCTWNAANTTCTGNVTASTGSWLGNFTGTMTQSVIGVASFTFTSPTTGSMGWNIGGVQGTKNISKLNYASGVSPSGINYTDIWWAGPTQNGWGLALLQQGGAMAGSWYTYNQQNQPVWYLINGGSWISSNVFTAPLTRATGSPLIGTTYNPAALNATTAGTVTLTFMDASNATMTYTVDGVTQTKTITRLAF